MSGVRNGVKLARKFVIGNKFQGLPKLGDLKIVEESLPALGKGEILCKAEWLTVDPYMRAYSTFLKSGDAMPGAQVARVIASESPEFPEGSQVVGNFGWRDLTISKVPPPEKQSADSLYKMPDLKGLPDSYALGSCGMPGVTAYFGLHKICEPKAGDTLVVSSAAGAVGSLVGQFGKIAGCRVLGFAGTKDKLTWLKNDLGFDEVFNYKEVNVFKTLKEHAPKGVNCYFDNVGGEFAYNVMKNMAMFGRIAVCGAITVYNDNTGKPPLGKFMAAKV
ncbi:Prostaglandin reductase 1 [Folsomia candida]|uniref:15-oxoprostaglandin 13-reductase n=1 Tax=Folsomia candida TaxID=158441 RepID=A0A226EMK0_FOLCA|nr:Prostaglandin reductase 1 [Folsomia candida]